MAESFELVGIDKHFGRLLSNLCTGESEAVFLGAALTSMATRAGHACLDLSLWASMVVTADDGNYYRCPELGEWLKELAECAAVGSGADVTPLVLEDDRLYLRRYWEYENDVMRFVLGRSGESLAGVPRAAVEVFNRLFPDSARECDWQRVAALAVFLRPFVVITGGPGTGKTTTVVRIIALLLECSENGDDLKIALTAPTGKAVMRLQGVMAALKEGLSCPDEVKEKIPTRVSTLHRLLGPRKDSPFFVHDENNRLPFDLVVVDEASMVDLPLMAKLLRALRPEAKLVLLGDRNQLASVEPGAVLGDICRRELLPKFSAGFTEAAAKITNAKNLVTGGDGQADSLVELQVSHRFGARSGIGIVGRAINRGAADEALQILRDEGYPDVAWRDIGSEGELRRELAARFGRRSPGWFGVEKPEEAVGALGETQVLCAVRQGPFGANLVNRYIEEILAGKWEVTPEAAAYQGRPLMVVDNNYEVNLFNGDTGLVLKDPESGGVFHAFFPTGGGEVRRIPLALLPEHETAYAMTIHKSQGSEFDEVVVILPDHQSAVLSRELLYTALTRARQRVEVWGRGDIFKDTVEAETRRHGGLRDKLLAGLSP